MTLRGRVVAAVAALSALAGAGSSEKSATATPDAAAALQSRVDAGGPDGGGAGASEGGGLEDTAIPASSGQDLDTRMRHLLEAVAQDNPDLASDALFPRDAYMLVRDTADPAKAWEKRVSTPFRRSVERTHKRMKGVERARFVSFELGHSIVQLTPKKKDFKKPLWRVKHSKLSFTIDGKTRHLDIAEMTAWRGAWYVTRLR
ncbi:MAG: hypothetical protein KIS78_25945 [Labilithrix sp.]|nr:hypothetical protein [Labilithrix sp.]